ncbi:MAG: alpha/beta hydrolase [Anaerolineae bacterium]
MPDEAGLVELSDGRRLAYSLFGAPQGRPAFYFHGTPGSRHEPSLGRDAATRHAVCIVALDHPGFGGSDYHSGRRLLDWPYDVLEAAQQLGLGRFGVVGASGGGPYALACAHAIPERLDFAAVMGSWAPVHGTRLAQDMAPLDRFFARLSGSLPLLFYAPFSLLALSVTRLSPQSFFKTIDSSMSGPDRELIRDRAVADFYANDMKEAFRQGVRGPADDAILLYQDWGFNLEEIAIPVHVFHGQEDKFAPFSFAEYLHRTIPQTTLHAYPQAGHLFLYKLFDEVFEQVLAVE